MDPAALTGWGVTKEVNLKLKHFDARRSGPKVLSLLPVHIHVHHVGVIPKDCLQATFPELRCISRFRPEPASIDRYLSSHR